MNKEESFTIEKMIRQRLAKEDEKSNLTKYFYCINSFLSESLKKFLDDNEVFDILDDNINQYNIRKGRVGRKYHVENNIESIIKYLGAFERTVYNAISSTFSWVESKQEYHFWNELSNDLRLFLNKRLKDYMIKIYGQK